MNRKSLYLMLALISVSITLVSLYSLYDSTSEEQTLEVRDELETDNKFTKALGNTQIPDSDNEGDSSVVRNSEDSGRLDTYASNYLVITVSTEMLARQQKRDEQLKELRRKWKLVTPSNLKFNSCYSKEFQDVNSALYSIAYRYFSADTFSDTSFKDYADPLYILAISNVEFGSETSPDVLLAPAIPTTRGIKVTKENILTFGYSDYLNYPNVLASDRDAYRGPMQIYVTGLTEAIKPNELLSCEYMQLMNAKSSQAKEAEMSDLSLVEGSNTTGYVDGMILANKTGSYGDRWNYGDAVNRLAGTVHANWLRYQKSNNITKTAQFSIDSKYSWIAMSAIGHNASPGIYYMSDNTDISNSYFWWPFGPYKNAREYSHYLGTKECSDYIRNLAYNAVSNYRSSKSDLQFRLSRQEGYEVAEELVSKGYIPNGLWKNTSWNNEEKIAYPIQVLYNYFILEGIYSGA